MNTDRLIEELEDQTALITFKLALLFKENVNMNIDFMTIHYLKYRELRKKLGYKGNVLIA